MGINYLAPVGRGKFNNVSDEILTRESTNLDDTIFGLQDRPSCCFAAPSEDENTDSRIYVSRYPKEDEK
jgi:hypothetical protein